MRTRGVDAHRIVRHTNAYTVDTLFIDQNLEDALKRELMTLKVSNYIETCSDIRFPRLSEMRVFGKVYAEGDVYIKVRIELVDTLSSGGGSKILIMSFHFSERPFRNHTFPYRD